jgi:hypothetical protein
VGKRLDRRLAELGLADLSAYRSILVNTPAEWAPLDGDVPNPYFALLPGSRRARRDRQAIAAESCSIGQRERRRRGQILERRVRKERRRTDGNSPGI